MPFKLKDPSKLVIGILIALFFGLAIFVRTYYTYHAVFVGNWIKFTTNDAYYQMRIVDLIVHNFPHLPKFDPYIIYPAGDGYPPFVFFNGLLSLVIWIFTLGSPTEHAVNVLGVYYPVILAALCVIPVYFIGKALFNKWAGVIAAGMAAILPGEFLGRSILGATDYAVAETLFSTTAIMFLILALKSAWQNQVSWTHVVTRNWKVLFKPLLFSLLAGVFMGIYFLTWQGAALFVFIITAYFVLQFVIDHFKGQSSFYLGFVGFLTFLPTLFISLPIHGNLSYKMPFFVALLIPLVLAGLSRLMMKPTVKPFYYPLTLAVLAVIFVIAFKLIAPGLFGTLLAGFPAIFHPGGPTGTTTIEMQPFLSPNGSFNIAVAWGNFTTAMFLIPWAPIPGIAIISLIVLLVLYFKRHSDNKPMMLLVIWTIIMTIATLSQRRFAYYLVINMAVLTSYLAWQGIWWFAKRQNHTDIPETLNEQYRRARTVGILSGIILFATSFLLLRLLTGHDMYFFVPVFIASLLSIFYGFWAWVKQKGLNDYMILWAFIFPLGVLVLAFSESKASPGKLAAAKNKTKKKIQFNKPETIKTEAKTKSKEVLNPWFYKFNIAALVAVVFITVFWPNWDNAKSVAAAASYAPSDAWVESLDWLRNNTPQPMDTSNYYKSFPNPASGSFDFPSSAYAVTTWWDYGYWITRIAQRLPSDNPNQAPAPITKVANLLLSEDDQNAAAILKELNTRYVMLDDTLTTSKIWAIMVWANIDSSKYIQIYYYQQGKQLIPIQVYTPEYYKLLSVRLYNFNGKASTSEKPMVLTYQDKTDAHGSSYRLVSNAQEFNSYQEAQNYISSHPDETDIIVGSSPFTNPVPIEAVPNFNLVFSSTKNDATSVNSGQAEVKIFQYSGN